MRITSLEKKKSDFKKDLDELVSKLKAPEGWFTAEDKADEEGMDHRLMRTVMDAMCRSGNYEFSDEYYVGSNKRRHYKKVEE